MNGHTSSSQCSSAHRPTLKHKFHLNRKLPLESVSACTIPCVRIGWRSNTYIISCLYLHGARRAQQYSNLVAADIRSHEWRCFPTLPLYPCEVDGCKPPCLSLFLQLSTSHRFNGDPCHDPTNKLACIRACTHLRSDDVCTCRVVHFENPTRSYLSTVQPPRPPQRESLI